MILRAAFGPPLFMVTVSVIRLSALAEASHFWCWPSPSAQLSASQSID